MPYAPRRRARVPRTALALLVLALVTAASAQLALGDRLVDEGRFTDAIAAYEAVLASDPADARALYRSARAAVYAADDLPDDMAEEKERLFALAAERAAQAAELAPDDPEAHFEIARALGRLAQYRGVLASLNLAGRVEDALERALALDPDHAGAWHARGLFHHDVPWIAGGRAGRVVPSFERAIAIEPDDIGHRLAFAEVLLARDDRDAARAQLEVAVTLTPRTYLARQDLDRARALLADLR